MRTEFSAEALQDPGTAAAEAAIRRCVRCGFCTSTCPTYVLSRHELEGPRGRIYLMKDMLENERSPTAEVVRHLDSCLSCLACVTTCPSDVNYRHLVDHSRRYIAENYRRPWAERAFRRVLLAVLSHRGRFALALALGALLRPLAGVLRSIPVLRPMARMLESVPPRHSRTRDDTRTPTPSTVSRSVNLALARASAAGAGLRRGLARTRSACCDATIAGSARLRGHGERAGRVLRCPGASPGRARADRRCRKTQCRCLERRR